MGTLPPRYTSEPLSFTFKMFIPRIDFVGQGVRSQSSGSSQGLRGLFLSFCHIVVTRVLRLQPKLAASIFPRPSHHTGLDFYFLTEGEVLCPHSSLLVTFLPSLALA